MSGENVPDQWISNGPSSIKKRGKRTRNTGQYYSTLFLLREGKKSTGLSLHFPHPTCTKAPWCVEGSELGVEHSCYLRSMCPTQMNTKVQVAQIPTPLHSPGMRHGDGLGDLKELEPSKPRLVLCLQDLALLPDQKEQDTHPSG